MTKNDDRRIDGPLEMRILGVFYDLGGTAPIRQVFEILYEERKLAYMTIATVCQNLVKK